MIPVIDHFMQIINIKLYLHDISTSISRSVLFPLAVQAVALEYGYGYTAGNFAFFTFAFYT